MQFKSIANPLWNPWANDKALLELYQKRCRQLVPEMTCASQAAQILSSKINGNETLLDAGCGAGYYFWSFYNRKIPIEYFGIDYTPEMIELAKQEMCNSKSKLKSTNFILNTIENIEKEYDNIICFNVLTNNPHYALPLERLLKCTKKRLLLRENLDQNLVVRYTHDLYIDKDKTHIKVYHNTYPIDEVEKFIENYGFKVTRILDERSKGNIEMVVDVPHRWQILLAEKI